MMRTTVNLPDDIYRIARDVAHVRNISLGDAIAELVRQGLRPSDPLDFSGPFPKFKVPPDAEPITLEQLLEAEDEL
jgi:hypothetical protein